MTQPPQGPPSGPPPGPPSGAPWGPPPSFGSTPSPLPPAPPPPLQGPPAGGWQSPPPPPPQPPRPSGKGRWIALALLLVVLVCAAGVGALLWVGNDDSDPIPTTKAPEVAGAAGAPQDADVLDFCAAYADHQMVPPADQTTLDTAHALAAKLIEVGTPPDMLAEEREGFELYVDGLADIDLASLNLLLTTGDEAAQQVALGTTPLDQPALTAHFSYLVENCFTPTSESASPTAPPTVESPAPPTTTGGAEPTLPPPTTRATKKPKGPQTGNPR